MSTQLHLVETRATRSTKAPKTPKTPKTPKSRRAVHWHTEWHLDDRTRQVGQEGVAAARQALAQARRPDEQLPRAS